MCGIGEHVKESMQGDRDDGLEWWQWGQMSWPSQDLVMDWRRGGEGGLQDDGVAEPSSKKVCIYHVIKILAVSSRSHESPGHTC